MVTLRRAAEQALAAIKSANQVNYSWACVEAVAALEAALAEPNKCTHGVEDSCKECYMADEQEPLEYWNAVEGWVKIDEVRQHFDSVGCGTIYKTSGDGRQPLYTAPPQRKPLSDEMQKQMKEQRCDSMEMRSAFIDGWLSAEAAHGIGGEHG